MSPERFPTVLADPTVITFPLGLCGFPEIQRYELSAWGGDGSPYRLMRALEQGGPEFVVVDPALFFEDYEVELDDPDADLIGIARSEDALVFVIVTLGDPIEDSTANLLGPVVVNTVDGRSVQAVQVSPTLTSRARLFAHRGPLATVGG
jgi:flagellar assembly factor FliW